MGDESESIVERELIFESENRASGQSDQTIAKFCRLKISALRKRKREGERERENGECSNFSNLIIRSSKANAPIFIKIRQLIFPKLNSIESLRVVG